MGVWRNPCKVRGITPVAAQDLQVQRKTFRIGGHGQENLGPVYAMIPAVAVATDLRRTLAFKINTGQVTSRLRPQLKTGDHY